MVLGYDRLDPGTLAFTSYFFNLCFLFSFISLPFVFCSRVLLYCFLSLRGRSGAAVRGRPYSPPAPRGMFSVVTLSVGGMESVLEQLKKGLQLTEEEETGVAVPEGYVDLAQSRLCLVRKLLSNKPYHFEGLCRSVQGMLNSMKGVDIKQLRGGSFSISNM
ncbi:hypothetical protein Salat_0905100 [Sesamum alatum]|uniref:Uncharacterized protein n=1 Tax=Sesamum alatum TaxID=300844 RepID=A0AAE1YJH6_9LAMI|nr:hypothetical protein Salat_0905100 [Sesamum alatum]